MVPRGRNLLTSAFSSTGMVVDFYFCHHACLFFIVLMSWSSLHFGKRSPFRHVYHFKENNIWALVWGKALIRFPCLIFLHVNTLLDRGCLQLYVRTHICVCANVCFLVLHFRVRWRTSCDSPRSTSTSAWWSVSWSSAASMRNPLSSPILSQTPWVIHPAQVSTQNPWSMCVCVCLYAVRENALYSRWQCYSVVWVCVLWGRSVLVKAGHTLIHPRTHRTWLLLAAQRSLSSLSLFNLSGLFFSAHFSISSQNPCPETTAGFLSTMTFWWFTRWVHTALCTQHPQTHT